MKVVVADSDCAFCKRICAHLQSMQEDIEIVTADNLQFLFDILQAAADFKFIFVSFELFGDDWKNMMLKLKPLIKKAKLIVLSSSKNKRIISFFLKCGCYSHLPKGYSEEVMKGAISIIICGCHYVPAACRCYKVSRYKRF
jgi:DNA-binding NarL/FixJ family response regulator